MGSPKQQVTPAGTKIIFIIARHGLQTECCFSALNSILGSPSSLGVGFITALLNTVLHEKGCRMTCDISKSNQTATTVCSSEHAVCHRVARAPSQKHKAQAEGL